ncbi:putative ribonuclease H-like domain-containing protein [Tanacetum coccineum]
MWSFPSLRGNKYILVAVDYFSVDYLSKRVKAKALPTNDARVVCKFLKSLFARFGTPRAIISDRGTHFCNDQLAMVMLKYGVTHRLSTAYHPQTSGQVEVSNRGLKQILERTIGENCASCPDKLDDALWAFRTAYKTPIGCTLYKLVYGKACHLPIELEHKAYWALKHANFDLSTAGDHRNVQLNELNKLCDEAYENSLIYKDKTKRIHDSKIKNRVFNVGDRVLLFNSRLKIFSGKLKTRWSGPFTITQVYLYGTVELSQNSGPNFKFDESMLWHMRLGHVKFKTINKLVKDNLVRGLPTKCFENDQICVACLKEKQHKASCKSKIQNSITQPLFMLHMDLFAPTFVSSLMNKKYCIVVTDDYSRFTWAFFLTTTDETSGILKSFINEIENLIDKKVKINRCANGTKFKNRVMSEFCEKKGIKRAFRVVRTPQQNGVAKRRNRTLIEAARTMVLVVKPHNKTPYELFRGRTPALSFMRPFGCHVTILNTLDYLGKFDGKSDEGFFVGYSLNSKAFRVYNIRTRKVEENLHIRFLEDKPIIAGDGPKWLFDIDVLTKSMNYVPVVAGTNSNDFVGTEESIGAGHSSKETGSSQDYILMPLWKDGSLFDSSSKNASNDEPQPSSNAEKKDDEGVSKASGFSDQEQPKNSTLNINTAGPSINTASVNSKTGSLNINTVSPRVITTRSNHSQNVSDMFSLGRSATLEATHANLFGDETEMDMSNLTTSYQVPTTPNTRIHKDHSFDHVIGDIQSGVQTMGMTKNRNEHGFISAVFEGKSHEDLHTCLFPCFLSQKKPKRIAKALSKRAIGTKWIFMNKKDERGIVTRNKIDVKSAFIYGTIEEEVYVCQPPGFEDPDYPDKVYEVVKALYGFHQAPRAWYETLAKYLLDNRFQRGKIDQTLLLRCNKEIFCFMSSIGELNFFLGLQVKQREDGIFISQDKYVAEILRKFGFTNVRTTSTPMDTEKPLLKDSDGDDVDGHLYR